MSRCGCTTPCPDPLDVSENTGCVKTINTECVIYNGDNVTCLGVVKGADLSAIIKLMAQEICDLNTEIDGLSNFACSKLSTCSIDNLGDVVITSATEDQVLGYNGTSWINITLPTATPFSCSDLSSCSIDNLADVTVDSPITGQALIYDGEGWINGYPTYPDLNAENGVHIDGFYTVKLGGALLQNTTIEGADFNLLLGEDSSKLDHLYGRSAVLDLSAGVISLNTTTGTSQTKGFLFKDANTSVSIGTSVFGAFDTYPGNYRIGDNITLAKTGILDPAGFFMGKNIAVDSSPVYIIGSDVDVTNFVGFVLGITNTAEGYAGGFLMGSEIDLHGGGTGNQSAYLFGAKIDVVFGSGINQSSLVFNPTNMQINSSATGNSANEKIRVDVSGCAVVAVNASDYYFFTDPSNTQGWNLNTDVVRLNKNFIQISQSTGSVAEQKIGCIRYNSGTDKYQGFTTATGWTDLH